MSARSHFDSTSKARRTHRKSRFGCRECKRRHIKCDERRPQCVNCTVSGKHCEYATIAVASTLSPRRGAYIDLSTSPAPITPCRPQPSEPEVLDNSEAFTLEHMRLLHHIEHGVTTWLGATESMVPLVEQYISTALTTPYLMNQLLALAALHLSYTSGHEAARHRSLATELQTRGLSLFNAVKDDSDGTARWYFSSLLAMHNLATTLAECHQQDFDTFLDNFIRHMGLHQGTQAIGKGLWETIRSSGLREWLDHLDDSGELGSVASSPSGSDPSMFARMLQSSRLNAASAELCWGASLALLHVRDKIQGPNCWGPHAVLAWLNLISKDFISLLSERIPEALVIMAHYAEMLYTYRDYWVFGDAGECLIKGLVTRLGVSWTRWLKRPLAVLSEADPH